MEERKECNNFDNKLNLFCDEMVGEVQKSLKQIRRKFKLSQEQLATDASLTKQTIVNLENYDKFLVLKTLIKLAVVYEVSISELLNIDDQIAVFIDKEKYCNVK